MVDVLELGMPWCPAMELCMGCCLWVLGRPMGGWDLHGGGRRNIVPNLGKEHAEVGGCTAMNMEVVDLSREVEKIEATMRGFCRPWVALGLVRHG